MNSSIFLEIDMSDRDNRKILTKLQSDFEESRLDPSPYVIGLSEIFRIPSRIPQKNWSLFWFLNRFIHIPRSNRFYFSNIEQKYPYRLLSSYKKKLGRPNVNFRCSITVNLKKCSKIYEKTPWNFISSGLFPAKFSLFHYKLTKNCYTNNRGGGRTSVQYKYKNKQQNGILEGEPVDGLQQKSGLDVFCKLICQYHH